MQNKKFLRTVISTKDSIQPARINLETGEIKAYPYRQEPKIQIKGSMHNAIDGPLFWQVIPPPDHGNKSIVSRGTIARKSKPNSNNVYLKEFETFDEARQELYILDNLITGISHLHSGRVPTCKGLLFRLLRDIDDINAGTIQAYTGYSPEYSRKLAQYLRVLSVAFDSEVER